MSRSSFAEHNCYTVTPAGLDADGLQDLCRDIIEEIDSYYKNQLVAAKVSWPDYVIEGLLDSDTFSSLRVSFLVSTDGDRGFGSIDHDTFELTVGGALFRFSRIRRFDEKMAIIFPGLPVVVRYND